MTFEEDLKQKLTPEVKAAWNKILIFMLIKLQEGYNLERYG